jgi:hypothetical protein
VSERTPFAQVKYAYDSRQDEFESELCEKQSNLDFDRITCDEYDNSIEFYEVPNDVRLGQLAFDFIKSEGFSKCWLNHLDGWETSYNLTQATARGWRKRQWKRKLPDGSLDPSGLIELEEYCESWPKEWYESGYARVVNGVLPENGTAAANQTMPEAKTNE